MLNGRMEFTLNIEPKKQEAAFKVNAKHGLIPVYEFIGGEKTLRGSIQVPSVWLQKYRRCAILFANDAIVETLTLTEDGWKPELVNAVFIKKQSFIRKLLAKLH